MTVLNQSLLLQLVAGLTRPDGGWHRLDITLIARRADKDFLLMGDIVVRSDGVVIHSITDVLEPSLIGEQT